MKTEKSSGQVDPPLVRVERAAELLSLSRSKIYELLLSGGLRSIKAGKARRVITESVYAYIVTNEVRI